MNDPNLFIVGREDFSSGPGDDDRDFDLLSPAERLSEAFPDEFAAYCEHFIDYFPKAPYFVKTTYDPASRFAGWPQRKSKRTKRPLALIDSATWPNRTDTVERHLDYRHWLDYQEFHSTGQSRRGDFCWLGLQMPKMTRYHALDADNKRVIGWYRIGSQDDDPILPVMTMPLEHFVFLRKLYDAFPGRIWCITSETLGLDIVERHALQDTWLVHSRIKRRLDAIGHGDVEVHPMPGRCKRRPFGPHYRTITQDRVLETWQQQLANYLAPGPTPTFRTIATALLGRLREQWRLWVDCGDAKNAEISPAVEVEQQLHQAEEVQRWLDDDCPDLGQTLVPVLGTHKAQPPTSHSFPSLPSIYHSVGGLRKNTKAVKAAPISGFDLKELRGGRWAKALAEIARTGLAADDSIGIVAFEMAKWLWSVELHDLPEAERKARIVGLLRRFVGQKHNNHITRWTNGQHEEVFAQIDRCLKQAQALNDPYSLQLMADLRQKREAGQYKRLIQLVPLIEGEGGGPGENTSSSLPPSSIYISVGTLNDLDSPLPAAVVDRIDKHRGRNKVLGYATRLLNFLHRQDKVCRISWEDLSQVFLGYIDRDRTNTYNKILKRAGVLRQDHYVRGKRCCGFALTEEAREIMDRARGETA